MIYGNLIVSQQSISRLDSRGGCARTLYPVGMGGNPLDFVAVDVGLWFHWLTVSLAGYHHTFHFRSPNGPVPERDTNDRCSDSDSLDDTTSEFTDTLFLDRNISHNPSAPSRGLSFPTDPIRKAVALHPLSSASQMALARPSRN